MSPTGDPRARKFTFVLTDEERTKLEELAAAERRTASDWIRVQIETAHAERFGSKGKRK